MGVFRPEAVMRNMLPVIMAGILGIYGLIVSVILIQKIPQNVKDQNSSYGYRDGFAHLSSFPI